MFVVLEGLPGAGKTTALRHLESTEVITIPEIIGKEPLAADEEFFLQNDLKKQRMIDASIGSWAIDRNFVSTLCYNFCHDKTFGTVSYKSVAVRIEQLLATGQLRQPDLYILLSCSVETSIARQNKTNNPVWSNKPFLESAHTFYLSYLKQAGCPYLVIDTTTHTVDKLVQRIDSIFHEIRN